MKLLFSDAGFNTETTSPSPNRSEVGGIFRFYSLTRWHTEVIQVFTEFSPISALEGSSTLPSFFST